uniref:hypothetical protein n=1 Tax=Amycolatopsis sp. CA-290885 TaxID=3239925 RepID=UPI003F495FE7
MVDAYTRRDQRKFPSPEMLSSAAALVPGLPASVNASRTWATRTDELALAMPEHALQLVDDQALTEGPQWYVSYSPGRVRVWTRDEARRDRTQRREQDLRTKTADALATWVEETEQGELELNVPERTPSREVTEWSRKSRSNMIGQYADLDFTPMFADPERLGAMLTGTYPRCWQTVAPNGKAVKKHMKRWRKAYEVEFQETIRCIWKLEFQDRHKYVYRGRERKLNWCECEFCGEMEDGRAPHWHMLVTLPQQRVARDSNGKILREPVLDQHGEQLRDSRGRRVWGDPIMRRCTTDDFKAWFSRSWADAVDHPNPVEYAAHLGAGTRVDLTEGAKACDPKRIITYFSKHSGASTSTSKEYQHRVPKRWQQPGEGPGRFWGYWGLEKAVVTMAVPPEIGIAAGRILRRHSRAQGLTRLTHRRRYDGGRVSSAYGEVIGLAGAQLLAAHQERMRPCRVRAVRAVQNRGWSVVNDGANMGAALARALAAELERRTPPPPPDLVETQPGLFAPLAPESPLGRALQLPPSPRRDALIARLRARQCSHDCTTA